MKSIRLVLTGENDETGESVAVQTELKAGTQNLFREPQVSCWKGFSPTIHPITESVLPNAVQPNICLRRS